MGVGGMRGGGGAGLIEIKGVEVSGYPVTCTPLLNCYISDDLTPHRPAGGREGGGS